MMKDNLRENKLLYLTLLFAVLVFGIALFFKVFSENEFPSRLIAAITGVIITAIITQLLLKGQGAKAREEKRDSKVFEERLGIYKAFMQKLCDIVEDRKVEEHEKIALQFQIASIAMHTSELSINKISEDVQAIIQAIENGNEELLDPLFDMADVFHGELYDEDTTADLNMRNSTISNFRVFLVDAAESEAYEEQNSQLAAKAVEKKGVPEWEVPWPDRLKIIRSHVRANGSLRTIPRGEKLVTEYFNEINPSTKHWKNGEHNLAIDVLVSNGQISIDMYTRQQSADVTRQLVEKMWGGKVAFNPDPSEPFKHVYKAFAMDTPNATIEDSLRQAMAELRLYRDKKWNMA